MLTELKNSQSEKRKKEKVRKVIVLDFFFFLGMFEVITIE